MFCYEFKIIKYKTVTHTFGCWACPFCFRVIGEWRPEVSENGDKDAAGDESPLMMPMD
jgi:hypothetical protein